MLLTLQNLIGYLADRQLLNDEALLMGSLRWKQVTSRNNVLHLHDKGGNGLSLKQLKHRDQEGVRLMKMEATVQHVLHYFSDYETAKMYTPEYHGYDARQNVLITGLVQDASNVWELTEQRERLSASHARKMGNILTRIHHDLSDRMSEDPTLAFLDQKLPWILSLPNAVNHAPEVVFQQIKQDDFLIEKLDETAHAWKSTGLIHGDVKLENFIATQAEDQDSLMLIDWEMANLGDPLWDLAGLMQSYISSGLTYMDLTATHYELPETKAFWQKEQVIKMWKQVWGLYSKKMNWTDDEAELAAVKTVGFMAARLLQSAAELNRVRPEFMAPGVLAMIAEAKDYFKRPSLISRQFNTHKSAVHDQ